MVIKLLHSLLRFLADPHCMLCNAPLEVGEYVVCSNCIKENHLFDAFQLQVTNNPMERRLHGTCITSASALMVYQQGEPSQKLIHDLKYHRKKRIAELLGKAMAEKIAHTPKYANIDFIVPVPIHKNKQRKRGYNQSELIAAEISKELGIPLVVDMLSRVSDNKAQANMSLEDRQENKIIFRLKDEKFFEDKNVLLIDDVFTTGTTVLSCVETFTHVKGINILLYTAASPLGK
ncbi:MAG: hypothetical protein MJ002_03080 [Paludibacteraceae bacterium]|nr:hypothetical protein [Paludibacteraceae bacterium]